MEREELTEKVVLAKEEWRAELVSQIEGDSVWKVNEEGSICKILSCHQENLS